MPDGSLLSKEQLLNLLITKLVDKSSDAAIDDFLVTNKIELIDKTAYEFQEVCKKVSVSYLIPIRTYAWESYHSSINNACSADVPAKQLTDAFKLTSQPQTFNLFEANGKLASISIKWGELYGNRHYLTYLRQDLLEAYMNENNIDLVWAIWGERQFKTEPIEAVMEYSKEHTGYAIFSDFKIYTQMVGLKADQIA